MSSYEYGAFSSLPGNHHHEEEELVRHSREGDEVCPLLGDVEPVRSPYAHLACTSSVIPFLRIPQECSNLQPIDAANLMLAALLAGCRSVEIAIATYPQAPQAIAILAQMLKDEYPELHTQNDQVVLCAGGIFTRTAASECVHAGASVLMSPICDTNLVRWATDEFGLRVDILPGAATPTEVHNAYAAGACAAKLFPCADPTGNGGWSPKAVVAMKRAMPGVRVVASGGIATPKDAKAFLDAGCDAAVVGAIFDYDAVKHADAARVGEQAKKFVLECL